MLILFVVIGTDKKSLESDRIRNHDASYLIQSHVCETKQQDVSLKYYKLVENGSAIYVAKVSLNTNNP